MWERTLSQKLVRLFCEQKVVGQATCKEPLHSL